MKEKNCKNCTKRIDKKCSVTDTYTPRKKPACADYEAKKPENSFLFGGVK